MLNKKTLNRSKKGMLVFKNIIRGYIGWVPYLSESRVTAAIANLVYVVDNKRVLQILTHDKSYIRDALKGIGHELSPVNMLAKMSSSLKAKGIKLSHTEFLEIIKLCYEFDKILSGIEDDLFDDDTPVDINLDK